MSPNIPHSDGVTHGAEYTQEVMKTIDFLLDKSLAVNFQSIENEMAAMHTRYTEAMGRGKGVLRNEPYFHVVRSHLDIMQQRDAITRAEKKTLSNIIRSANIPSYLGWRLS